jgi:hypothetical protein
MVLNSKDLNQKGERDFNWANNALKSYRKEIEDDENILKSFLKENVDLQEVRRKFEEDKEEFLVNYYNDDGKPSLEFTKKFEKFLRAIGEDIDSFYIFSETVKSTYYKNLLENFVWNPLSSEFEIKNSLSGLLNNNTEVEVVEYVTYVFKNSFVFDQFSNENIDIQRIEFLHNLMEDIHFLVFSNEFKDFSIKLSFDDFKLKVLNFGDTDDSIYIKELMGREERSSFDIMIANCLFFENLMEDRLLTFFSQKIKEYIDNRLSDILMINSPIFKLENVTSGAVPLFMFTDSQILDSLNKCANVQPISMIKLIKDHTSEYQFERFMSLLYQILG